LRVLFVGGTGNISLTATKALAGRGFDLTVLNRGQSGVALPDRVRSIRADMRDPRSVAAALGEERFDVVVDWIAFSPAHVEADIRLFGGKVGQYVFISSATVYRKPPPVPVTEEAPLGNSDWPYAAEKLACEERLRREHEGSGFPVTIVRPSHTYGETHIPTAVDGVGYTIVDRMRRGKQVVVPGDGTSLWTMTHADDFARAFAGLLGNPDAVGESFHITSDEVLTWDQITQTIGTAAGVEPEIVHIPSDFIAAVDPDLGRELLGDRAHSLVFDNAKIKRLAPDFGATVSFAEGIRRSIGWFDADRARQVVDRERSELLDRIVAAYERARPNP
jgi:nucleoside-diphosphate-sugar epimerase